MDKILTKERRNALGSLLTNWFSKQDNDGRMLDTFNYFDVDTIDALIDEAIAPTIADAVMCSTAALASDAAGVPEPVAWMHEKAETFVIGCHTKQPFAKGFVPLYAAPVAPAAPEGWKLVPVEATTEVVEAIAGTSPMHKWPDDYSEENRGLRRKLAATAWRNALAAAPTPTVAADAAAPSDDPALPPLLPGESDLGRAVRVARGSATPPTQKVAFAAQPDERAAFEELWHKARNAWLAASRHSTQEEADAAAIEVLARAASQGESRDQ